LNRPEVPLATVIGDAYRLGIAGRVLHPQVRPGVTWRTLRGVEIYRQATAGAESSLGLDPLRDRFAVHEVQRVAGAGSNVEE